MVINKKMKVLVKLEQLHCLNKKRSHSSFALMLRCSLNWYAYTSWLSRLA